MLPLGATTLLHEAYLVLHDRDGLKFPDNAHFLAYASRTMRGLIIDFVRRGQTLKRGADCEFTQLFTNVCADVGDSAELQRVSDALDCLSAIEPRLAQVVDLKFFCGFSFKDIAAMWDMCERTIQRDWDKARLFLHRRLAQRSSASTRAAVLSHQQLRKAP